MPASGKPAALLISPEAPYPLDGGGALRTASLLQYLGERYQLDLIVFQHAGQQIIPFLPERLVRRAQVIPLREHANSFAARALRNGSRMLRRRPPLVDRFSGYEGELDHLVGNQYYDLVVLEHFWSASYAPHVRRFSRRVVLDLHNVESAWHSSCAHASHFPRSLAHRIFARAALRLEKSWLRSCDLVLTTSDEDMRRVEALAPGIPVCVYPNAIPRRDPLPVDPTPSLAFSGNLEYEPNRSGLEWFLQRVWPALKQRFPALTFSVIGKNNHALPKSLTELDGVQCTGPVEDPFPFLARAQVCVAPLLSGSGTRLKIIEAWAAGRAVVSTKIGAEGLGAVDGESILIADSPEMFTTAITRLLLDPNLRQNIAVSGQATCERNFTWNVAWKSLEQCLSCCKP